MNRITNSIATHFMPVLYMANSYPQMGQTLLLGSISIAQDGHSFVFIELIHLCTQ